MIAYGYDDNGYYSGEKNCQKDPLESISQGKDVWLLPAKSTWIEPLEQKEGFKVKYVEETKGWEYEEIPPEPVPPEPTEDEIKEKMLSIRDSYFISEVDWYQSKPWLLEEMDETEISYRKEYRDYLKTYNDAEEWWKAEPLNYEDWLTAHHPVNE